jgi:alanine racemase
VVKADAYGMDADPVEHLAGIGCIHFIARLREGIALRPAVPQARIFADGACTMPAGAIANRLIPVLNCSPGSELEQSARKLRTMPRSILTRHEPPQSSWRGACCALASGKRIV